MSHQMMISWAASSQATHTHSLEVAGEPKPLLDDMIGFSVPTVRAGGIGMTIGTLSTLGYAAKSAACILETLLSEPGTLLVDVRMRPGSRRYPEWRRNPLERRSRERYVHVPTFGNVHYRTPDQPIQLANPEAGVRWAIPLLQQGRSLVLLCVCKDDEQCHRKLVFDVLTLRLADTVRAPQQMRYEPATGLYQGITTGDESHVLVVPDIFDWNRDLLDEELYDPNGWAREADGEHAWVAQLEVRI